jgi:hypothetical protein
MNLLFSELRRWQQATNTQQDDITMIAVDILQLEFPRKTIRLSRSLRRKIVDTHFLM